MNETPVTIREAIVGSDDYLAEHDATFDVSAGLADLMARIDRQEVIKRADVASGLPENDDATPGELYDLRARWERQDAEQRRQHRERLLRMRLEVIDRRTGTRRLAGIIVAVSSAGLAVLTNVLIATFQLSWVAIVGLSVVAVVVACAAALATRWSSSGENRIFEALLRDEHRRFRDLDDDEEAWLRSIDGNDLEFQTVRRVRPPREDRKSLMRDPSRSSIVADSFKGDVHVENHYGEPRMGIERSALVAVMLALAFGAASWSAVQGVLAPLTVLGTVLVLAMLLTGSMVRIIARMPDSRSRESAERVLAVVLGRGIAPCRVIEREGIGTGPGSRRRSRKSRRSASPGESAQVGGPG